MNVAFFIVAIAALLSGILWLLGMKYLARDTAAWNPAEGPETETAGATRVTPAV
jgi:hypothetical protein